jgi:hypothetical protein
MSAPKTLLDCLLDPVESERVSAIAQLLYQADSYTRALSLMLGGMAAKSDPVTARDLYSIQQSAENICDWLSAHWIPLYEHSTPTASGEFPAMIEETAPADSTIH